MREEKYYEIRWKEFKEKCSSCVVLNEKIGYDEFKMLLAHNSQKLYGMAWHIISLSVGRKSIIESDDLSGIKHLWPDYIGNGKVLPIMSEKMKDIIESNLKGTEGVFWIPITIEANGEVRPYYILRFQKQIKVLYKTKTEYLYSVVSKAVFYKDKALKYSVIPFQDKILWSDYGVFYVNSEIKRQLVKADVTGIKYTPVELTDG